MFFKKNKRDIVIGGIYKHFKGNLYKIIATATDVNTNKRLVIYTALYGNSQTHIRPLNEFLSTVDRKKYPSLNQNHRFELVNERG